MNSSARRSQPNRPPASTSVSNNHTEGRTGREKGTTS